MMWSSARYPLLIPLLRATSKYIRTTGHRTGHKDVDKCANSAA